MRGVGKRGGGERERGREGRIMQHLTNQFQSPSDRRARRKARKTQKKEVEAKKRERERENPQLLPPPILLGVSCGHDGFGRDLLFFNQLSLAHVGVDDVDVAYDLGRPFSFDLRKLDAPRKEKAVVVKEEK